MQRVGLSFLILASLSRWFLRPGANLSGSVVDATTGFLYGVAIGSLLASLWLRRPRRPTPGGGPAV